MPMRYAAGRRRHARLLKEVAAVRSDDGPLTRSAEARDDAA